MRLGMSLVVRDEEDVIGENIHFHASMGVDCFAVLDNGSKDSTREIVSRLCTTYDITLFDDPGNFEKERQSMLLARHLQERQGADWLISNDADEFWLPENASLKSLINNETPVLSARRYNFVPREQDVAAANYAFYHNIMLVERPYGVQPPSPDPNEPLLYPMMLRAVPGKIICALEGLEHIFKGSHRVTHARGKANETSAATIFHYQIRSYKAFETKIINHGKSLQNARGATSWHLRRWHAAYANGQLKQEYQTLLLNDGQTKSLLADGVIRENHMLANIIRRQRYLRKNSEMDAF
jgi:hypothetical protein